MGEDFSSRRTSFPAGGKPTEALKASEVLELAAELIEPEGCWTQHVLAKSKRRVYPNGQSTGWRRARCFCVSGAIGKVDDWASEAIHFLQRSLGNGAVAWNDAPGRTQAEAVAALRAAAALAESEGR